jgi:hypothetical protein
MELEELKSNWSEMSQQLEKQKKLTNELIMKMAAQRSNSIFQPIIVLEKLGMVVTSAILLYIFTNIEKLNDWLSIAGAICTVIILTVGLVISVVLIKNVQNIDIVKNNYRQTLLDVNSIKKNQYSANWISACLAPVLAFSILPTLAATWFDKSLLYDLEEYRESLIPCLLLIPIIWYFISRFYANKLAKINELLEEIKQ